MGNIAHGHAFRPHDLFLNFDRRKLKSRDKNRDEKIPKVFTKSMQLIIEDIINNNVQFKFPGQKTGTLEVMRVSGDKFKRAYKKGKFRYVDFLETNFCGYDIAIRYPNGHYKVGYVQGDYRRHFHDLINSGKQY